MPDLLFDLDGTLTDNYLGIARSIAYALDALGVAPPDAADAAPLRRPAAARVVRWLLDTARRRRRSSRRSRCTASASPTSAGARTSSYDGIAEALAALAAATRRSTSARPSPRSSRGASSTLFGFAEHFRGVYGADLAGRLDDKAKLLAHCARPEGIDPGARDHDRRPRSTTCAPRA